MTTHKKLWETLGGLPLILDGATGTELQKRGYDGSSCPEAWILEHPELIKQIQTAYFQAGSNIVYTPTFGANRVKLSSYGLGDKVHEYNVRLARLSRDCAGESGLVAGDLAPTGKFLYPVGDMSFEQLYEIYLEQATALLEGGVDLFVAETMMTLAEARAAVLAVKSICDKPVFCSFTCDEKGRTLSGTDVTCALVIMQGMGVDAFGLNCSVGPEDMLLQLQRLSHYAQIPLLAKPNAGMPEMIDGRSVYRCTPELFSARLPEMAQLGVGVFGGCCGTDSGHIAAIAALGDRLIPASPKPVHTELLPCASERNCRFVSAASLKTEPIACGEDLYDDIAEAMEEDEEIIRLSLEAEEDIEALSECAYMIDKALCFVCEDSGLLEKALRAYQGRAMYEGGLEPQALRPLVQRYGLILQSSCSQ